MTGYEYLDGAQSNYSNALNMGIFLFTLVSGYFLVAYSVGKKFSRFQIFIINSHYLMGAAFLIVSTWGFMESASELSRMHLELVPEREWGGGSPAATLASVIMQAILVFGSIWFMWDVRHRKSE